MHIVANESFYYLKSLLLNSYRVLVLIIVLAAESNNKLVNPTTMKVENFQLLD